MSELLLPVVFDLVFLTGGKLTTLLGDALWLTSFASPFILSFSPELLLPSDVNNLGSSVSDLNRPTALGIRDEVDTALELRLNHYKI